MRSHILRPITDESGNLLYNAQITVREATVAAPISQAIYSAPSGSSTLPNPFTTTNGYIDIWVDNPQRVSLLVQVPGRDNLQVYLDLQPAASEVVRTLAPLTILSAPVINKILTGTSGTEADWADPPAPVGGVPPHYHPGTGSESVGLGLGALGSGDESTAVGNGAVASGLESSAFGHLAVASGAHATALGAEATAGGAQATVAGYQAQGPGQYVVAVGYAAVANQDNATAIGAQATASAQFATALGYQAQATFLDAVAVGHGAQALASKGVALGAGAVVGGSHDNSVAIGPGAASSASDQIKLGTATHSVLVLGELRALADVHLAGSAAKVGFYGSAGAVKQTVTGSRGGNAPLAALLTYLAAIGLITDSTTA